MPRPPDSTALSAQDADAVRDLVTQLKAETGFTTASMADRIEPNPDRFDRTVRRIDNAMSRARRLLDENAVFLLQAVNPGSDHPAAQRKLNNFLAALRLKNGWLARYEWRQLRPSVFIPKHEIERLAAFLANEVGGSATARQRLANHLSAVLQKEASKMASSWSALWIGTATLPAFDRLFTERREAIAAATDRFLEEADRIETSSGSKKARRPTPQSLDRQACIQSLVQFAFPERKRT